MAKAMIVSVGTGTRSDVNIVNPLVKTVRNSDPSFVFFIVSRESENHAREVALQTKLPEGAFRCMVVDNPDDVEKSFLSALQALHEIRSRGYDAKDIIADYTSGTKAMTAGLALAAVAFRCESLKYIYGTRKNGVVIDGTEKFLHVSPAAILAISDVQLARHLMLQLRFEAAAGILSATNDALLTPQDKDLKDNLKTLANAYARWDHFDHRTFCGEYGKVKWQDPELEPFRLRDNLPHSRLIPLAENLNNGKLSLDCLADLYNNARRREIEGRYDDAVARLYRLTEMLAQFVLSSQYGIQTSDIQIENGKLQQLDPSVREQLERYRSPSDGKIKIGLEMSYWLLSQKGNPIGEAFVSNSKLKALLKSRNDSILAHGTKPIKQEIFESLVREVLALIKHIDAKFELRAKELQFPWLANRGG